MSSLWSTLGQASNVAQLASVDAFGLVSMVVQVALAARRHRDACRRLAQHVELAGGLLRELELAVLMRRDATRRPLEQLRGALRRCYALVRSCQEDGGYFRRLLAGACMVDELRSAQHEIDMYIRLIPLIALVDTARSDHPVTAAEEVTGVLAENSNLHTRFLATSLDHTKPCKVGEQLLVGKMDLQEEKIMTIGELVTLCTRTEESCQGFRKFDYFQLVDGTDNFSDKRVLGHGGFGKVYKGELPDGLTVAIKRFDKHATVSDFESEIQVARLQHTNICRSLGWCIHSEEMFLVYEFMHNGALHNIIFDRTKGELLNWSKRLKIIKALVEGLVYLHKHSLLWIVHRDLKPKNILLDGDMNPKISDFGSARTLSSDVAEEQTNRIVGTGGYMAPEYASRGLYSAKTDVFSFGILVLVIVSGRRNTVLDRQGDTIGDLVREARRLWKIGVLHELVDPSLGDGYEIAGVRRCTQVALLCAQEDQADRPTMRDVVKMLNSERISLLPYPKKPADLGTELATSDDTSLTYIGQSSSTIDITITSSSPMSTRVRIIVAPEN